MNKSQSKYFHTAVKFNKALLVLLEKKPFTYITISEICKEAGVNRSTFYLHYENLSDLLQETTEYVMKDFASYFSVDTEGISSQLIHSDLEDLNFITDQYLHPYLQYVKENRRIFQAVLSQPMQFKTNAVYQQLFEHIFNPILARFQYPHEQRKYVMMFYLNGITAVVKEWIQDGCEKSIEEMSEIICACIFGRDKPN